MKCDCNRCHGIPEPLVQEAGRAARRVDDLLVRCLVCGCERRISANRVGQSAWRRAREGRGAGEIFYDYIGGDGARVIRRTQPVDRCGRCRNCRCQEYRIV